MPVLERLDKWLEVLLPPQIRAIHEKKVVCELVEVVEVKVPVRRKKKTICEE